MIFFLFAAASCTVDTKLEIHDDASGRAEVTVTLHPVAVMYMADITMSFSGAGANGPFDIDAIRRAFLARPGIKLETIETVNDNTLRLTALFDDVRNLLAPPEDAAADGNPITFGSNRGAKEFRLQLSRSNFNRISGLFVLPDSPFTVLLPYAKEDFMPKEEYLEALSYALEDYLGKVSVDEFMRGALVHATVIPGGPVTAAAGGSIVNGNAEFSIPLIDVLTLEKGIDYSVTWK